MFVDKLCFHFRCTRLTLFFMVYGKLFALLLIYDWWYSVRQKVDLSKVVRFFKLS